MQGGVSISANVTSELLLRAIGRYQDLVELRAPHSPAPLQASAPAGKFTLRLMVADEAEELAQETDESYTLSVAADGTCYSGCMGLI